MTYKQAMSYIRDTAKFGNNYGLSRTEKILELLGNPHKNIKCIHIAGTNGKGSTTAMINEILCRAGYKVGMYTSPYLEEFEERIQINNENISRNDLAKIITEVSRAVDKVILLGYEHPTEFEIITCAMYLHFYLKKVDYAVIEVGLGGRLDSTNVINPIISVISSISYDHMNILGSTLKEIAGEKAGIIKDKVPVICYPQQEEAFQVIKDKCIEKHCELISFENNSVKFIHMIERKCSLAQLLELHTNKNSYNIELSLLGEHQLLNCALAVNTIEKLCEIENIQISKDVVLGALSKVKWPGRLEIMKFSPKVVIDGAHNIDGIIKLRNSITKYFKYDNIILILGILADKEVEKMIQALAPLSKRIIAVTPHSERGEMASELEKHIKKYNKNCEAMEDYREAYKKALTYASKEDIVIISGSLYMIGDMRKIIKDLDNN